MSLRFSDYMARRNVERDRRKRSLARRTALSIEQLESRHLLDGTGFAGNECPPDLDLSTIPEQTVSVGETLTLDLLSLGATAEDTDLDGLPTGDQLTFQLDPDVPDDTPVGAVITTAGVLSWTPTADQEGTHVLIVIIMDAGTPVLADAETITVVVNPMQDQAPQVDLNGVESGSDFATTFTESEGPVPLVAAGMTVTDADDTELASARVEFVSRPDGSLERLSVVTSGTSISADFSETTGVLTLSGTDTVENYQQVLRTLEYDHTSDAPTGGDRVVEVIVNDGMNDSEIAMTTVTVVPVNDAPDLAAIADQQALEGQLLEVTVTASDAENDDLTFQLDPQSNTPTGATIEKTSDTTAIIRWTPQQSDGPGPFTFRAIVTDDGSPAQSDVEEFEVSVLPVNDAPNLMPIADQQISVGELMEVTVTASDPEDDDLTFQLDPQSSTPTAATIEKTSGTTAIVRWTPEQTDGPGPFQFTVIVTDDGSAPQSDVEVFSVTLATESASNVSLTGTSLPALAGTPDTAVGQIAPEFSTVNFQGETVSLTHDGQSKLVGFFAHWCPHCQAEIPRVVNWLNQNSLPGNVDVVAVSTAVDPDSDNYPPSSWFDQEAWPFDVSVDTAESSIAQAYGLSAFPFWAVIDGNGEVLVRTSGELTDTEFAELVTLAASN